MRKVNDIFNKIEKFIYEAPKEILDYVLYEHDKWFNSFEDMKEERKQLNINDKSEIIHWIMSSDPIFVEGGFVDFMDFIFEKKDKG